MRPSPTRILGATVAAVLVLGLVAAAPAGARQQSVRVVASPGEGRNAHLNAVSFASASAGWAVGSRGQSLSGTGLDTLIQRWDGSRWRTVPTDPIATSDEVLTGVAAVSADDAWAVGWQDRYGYSADLPILLHWDGSTWSSVTGAVTTGRLAAVSASGAGDVWAIGADVVQHFDGHGWQLVASPAFAPPHTYTSISAAAPGDVWMAGMGFLDGYPGRAQVLVQHWDGSAWHKAATPATATDDRIAAVSAAAGDVWVVGSSGQGGLALHSNGAGWTRSSLPPAGNWAAFTSIARGSAGDVWAVGHQDGLDDRGYAVWHTMVRHFDGTAWQTVRSPNPHIGDAWLAGATITGPTAWMVGSDGDTLVTRGG